MTEIVTYSVPGMSSGHCRAAITAELIGIAGVESVDVDLATKLVRISGKDLDSSALTAAIDAAGYAAVRTT